MTANKRLRHCEPTGRANARPMTGSAKKSSFFPDAPPGPRSAQPGGRLQAQVRKSIVPLERVDKWISGLARLTRAPEWQ